MPYGHIRGVQTHRKDLASASEWMIYPLYCVCPTISAAHETKLLITDERTTKALQEAAEGL